MLLKILRNRSVLKYGIIVFIFIVLYLYHLSIVKSLKFELSRKEEKVQQLNIKLLQCEENKLLFERNNISKDNVIKSLEREIDKFQRLFKKCQTDKDSVIKKLRKIINEKPKDVKPVIIKKQDCELKIETKESLNEKDIIFNEFINIGK